MHRPKRIPLLAATGGGIIAYQVRRCGNAALCFGLCKPVGRGDFSLLGRTQGKLRIG